MIGELLGVASPFALLIMTLAGIAWGTGLARAVAFHLPLGLGALITLSFLLLLTAIRGFDSPTPELSVARNLGAVVLWLVFIGATALTWRLTGRSR